MYNDMRRDSEPVEQGPVQAITSQMKRLIEIGGEPFDRDVDLVNKHRLQYGITKIGIDVDASTGVFRCVVTRQPDEGEFMHQDWYKVTPTSQIYYEEVVVLFEYEERIKLAAYEKELANWQELVARLQRTDKLSDIDALIAMDGFMADYMSTRADFYRWSHALHSETDSNIDQMRQEELERLKVRQREILSRHLHGVRVYLDDEDFSSYKARFEAVLSAFTGRLDAMDAAESRLGGASREVNERFDLDLSDHGSLEQAWRLLALLDACQDYTD